MRDDLREKLRAVAAAECGAAGARRWIEHLGRGTFTWAVRKGYLRRLAHGVYTTGECWAAADDRGRHRLLVRAHLMLNQVAVASGRSAAVVHGLPLPYGPPQLPELTRPRDEAAAGAIGRNHGSLRRQAWLAGDEVTVVDGLRVTSAVRTVVDCARELGPTWGLAVADAAVALGLMGVDDLRDHLLSSSAAPGNRYARWVAEHVKDDVESPLESLARGVVILGGYPEPLPQQWISTRLRRFRVDLLDVENRVVLEADGKVKYVRDPDGDPEANPFWDEKLRQQAIEDEHFEVVRFTMADHGRRQAFWRRYDRAIVQARRFRL